MALFNTELLINLHPVTIFVTIVLPTVVSLIIVSLITDSLTTIGTTFSFVITAISSSLLTSLRSDFLIGGTPTHTTTTDALTITVLMNTPRYTITGTGTV